MTENQSVDSNVLYDINKAFVNFANTSKLNKNNNET